jgi:hypothetical protein
MRKDCEFPSILILIPLIGGSCLTILSKKKNLLVLRFSILIQIIFLVLKVVSISSESSNSWELFVNIIMSGILSTCQTLGEQALNYLHTHNIVQLANNTIVKPSYIISLLNIFALVLFIIGSFGVIGYVLFAIPYI